MSQQVPPILGWTVLLILLITVKKKGLGDQEGGASYRVYSTKYDAQTIFAYYPQAFGVLSEGAKGQLFEQFWTAEQELNICDLG